MWLFLTFSLPMPLFSFALAMKFHYHTSMFFENLSGLMIYKSKCQIMGLNCDDEKIRNWAEVVVIVNL